MRRQRARGWGGAARGGIRRRAVALASGSEQAEPSQQQHAAAVRFQHRASNTMGSGNCALQHLIFYGSEFVLPNSSPSQ